MWKHLRQYRYRTLCRSGRGATLIEVVIAVVVLGMLVAAVPPVMVMVANAQFRNNELNIAQDVTRSQFEYIKAQDYNNGTLSSTLYDQVPLPSGYSMQVAYDWIDPSTGNITSVNEGIQRVTITVFGWRYNPANDLFNILKTTDYKVNRSLQISGWEVNG
jgi:type II secretory pathway pseudopilin PulG